MIDWDELRFFVAVCREGSFAAAAKELRVDETTVARRSARLEARLGARLFSRTPDGLALTAAGEQVRASAEQMERSAVDLERRAMGADRRLAGRVRITAPELIGLELLLPALEAVRARHPSILLELVPTNLRLDIARAEADVAVRTTRPAEAGLVCRRLGRFAMATYLRRGALPGALVVFSEASRPAITPIDELLPEAPIALRTSSSRAVLEAVRCGFGAGDVPCFLGDADPRLARAFPELPLQFLELWLVVHADVRRTARVRAVVRAIAESIARARPRLEGDPPAAQARKGRT